MIAGFPNERQNRYRLPGSIVLVCRDNLQEERKGKCLAVSDGAPMLNPLLNEPF